MTSSTDIGHRDNGRPDHTETAGLAPGDQVVVPSAMRLAAAWSWRIVAVIAAGYLVVRGLGPLSALLIPILVAVLLTVLLRPAANFLSDKLHFKRFLAAITTLVVLLLLVAGALTLAGTQVADGISGLNTSLQEALSGLKERVSTLPFVEGKDVVSKATSKAPSLVGKNASGIFSGAISFTTTAGSFIVGLLICLFATVFFVTEGERIWAWLVRLLPKRARYRTFEASKRGWLTLASYVRIQILVAAIDAVGIALGAWLLGLDFVIPILLIVFLFSFVPVVGAIVSGAIAVLVALVQGAPRLGDWGLSSLDTPLIAGLLMVGIVLVVQQLESQILQPFLMGAAVSLHPLAVILVVAIGSTLLGIAGALFAVPVAAVVNTVVLYLSGNQTSPDSGRAGRLRAIPNPFLPSGEAHPAGAGPRSEEGTVGDLIDTNNSEPSRFARHSTVRREHTGSRRAERPGSGKSSSS